MDNKKSLIIQNRNKLHLNHIYATPNYSKASVHIYLRKKMKMIAVIT